MPQLLPQHLDAQLPQILPEPLILRLTTNTTNLPIGNNILPDNPLRHDILTRRRKQRRPAPLLHRIRHERPRHRRQHRPDGAVRVLGLLLLVRADGAGVRGVGVQQVLLAGLLGEAELAGVLAALEGADEEDLREFAPVIEVGWADVLVDFGERGEGDGGGGGAVEVGGLPDEAGAWGRLEVGEEGQGEVHLGEDVDLHVGVCCGRGGRVG